jgi:hypothetical protein
MPPKSQIADLARRMALLENYILRIGEHKKSNLQPIVEDEDEREYVPQHAMLRRTIL